MMTLFDLEPQRPGDVALRAWDFREARILQVAVRLRLFTLLHQSPSSASALAERAGSDGELTERLLIALGAQGLLLHDGGTWRNTLAADLYLVEGLALYQGDVILLAAEEWERYHHLERLVREGLGEEERERLMERNASGDLYLRALHAMALAGLAQRTARLLEPLAARKSLLDVGGAPGTVAVALCQRFPALHVTLLDEAERRASCEAHIAQAALGPRLRFEGKAWRTTGWGKGRYEVVRLGFVLGGSESDVLTPLMRAYDALKPGGLLAFQSFLLNNDLNECGRAALVNMLDSLFTLEQMYALLAEAGFERITLLHRDSESGDLIVAHKPHDELASEPTLLMAVVSPEPTLEGLAAGEDGDAMARQRESWRRALRPGG